VPERERQSERRERRTIRRKADREDEAEHGGLRAEMGEAVERPPFAREEGEKRRAGEPRQPD
jgi:hypothetical protein